MTRINFLITDADYEELTALCEAMGTGTVSETIRTLIREKREAATVLGKLDELGVLLAEVKLDIDTIRREFFAMKYEGKNPFKD